MASFAKIQECVDKLHLDPSFCADILDNRLIDQPLFASDDLGESMALFFPASSTSIGSGSITPFGGLFDPLITAGVSALQGLGGAAAASFATAQPLVRQTTAIVNTQGGCGCVNADLNPLGNRCEDPAFPFLRKQSGRDVCCAKRKPRRMNPLNGKAAGRAVRRLVGAKKAMRTISRALDKAARVKC